MKWHQLILGVIICSFYFGIVSVQGQVSVEEFKLIPNGKTVISGNLAKGRQIEDLSWASSSSVACFPATQNEKFRGNHLLYRTTLPAYSEIKITLVPLDKNANFSLYGYQLGVNNLSLVPNLASCVACEADHKWDYPKVGRTQDHTRSISFNSLDNAYNITIGVAGAKGQLSGAFTLEMELVTREEASGKQESVKVFKAASEKGKTLAYKGNLKDGVLIHDLSWAARSSVACFPGTQNTKFRGKHLLFETSMPERSVMTITVEPKDKNANFSLYAYQVGLNNKVLVPELASCVTCEADYKWDYPKRGKTQDHTRSVSLNTIQNPFRVVIGVAGAEGLSEGEFKLLIKVE